MDAALRRHLCWAQRRSRWEPASSYRANSGVLSLQAKDRVIKAKDIDSTVTGMSHGHPIRCLRNKMTREYLKLEKEGRPFEELEYLTLGTLRKAVMEVTWTTEP